MAPKIACQAKRCHSTVATHISRRVILGRQIPTETVLHSARRRTCRPRTRRSLQCFSSTTRARELVSAPQPPGPKPANAHILPEDWRYTIWVCKHTCGAAVAIFMAYYFGVDQEQIERLHPTPSEWSYWTRFCYRSACRRAYPEEHQLQGVDWPTAMKDVMKALARLEDPNVDGQGVATVLTVRGGVNKETRAPRTPGQQLPLTEPESLPHSDSGAKLAPPKNISAKSEAWRRGYYEILSLMARAAEALDGWVLDTASNKVVPIEAVLAPAGSVQQHPVASAHISPRPEQCRPLEVPLAQEVYSKILSTIGFTAKEKMEAALDYAAFLDRKKDPDAAYDMLLYALRLVDQIKTPYHGTPPYDAATLTIPDKARPSANHLRVLTQIATHKARHGDLEHALAMLVSLLRARKQLPPALRRLEFQRRANDDEVPATLMTTWDKLRKYLGQPRYPGRLPDGSQRPQRDSAERCMEAALHTYIGEILFVNGHRQEGLAWTRQAVDIAEDESNGILDLELPSAIPWLPRRDVVDNYNYRASALRDCRDCLKLGLMNWHLMLTKMRELEIVAEIRGTRGKSAASLTTSATPTSTISNAAEVHDSATATSADWGWPITLLWRGANGGGAGHSAATESRKGDGTLPRQGPHDNAPSGDGSRPPTPWEAEQKVVNQRWARAQPLLDMELRRNLSWIDHLVNP